MGKQNLLSVVVADDEQELLGAVCQLIDWEGIGFRLVGRASNGLDALQLVEELQPDFLLTDIHMPFISGTALAAQVKAVQPLIQVAFLSGYDEFEYAQQGIACEVTAGADGYYHPGRCARLSRGGVVFAQVGEVHPAVRERFDMPRRAVMAELNMQLLLDYAKPMGEMKPLPRFPAVSRDLALVMEESVCVGPLMSDMRKAGGNLLESIELFDVYRGLQVGPGRKSAAFSLSFRASDRTLTEADVQKAMDKVQKVCAEKYSAAIRG